MCLRREDKKRGVKMQESKKKSIIIGLAGIVIVLVIASVYYMQRSGASGKDQIIRDLERETAGENSYMDENGTIYVGGEDKKFIIDILKNAEKVCSNNINEVSGMLCAYMIRLGESQLGYKNRFSITKGEYEYLFFIREEDIDKINIWIDGLRTQK